MFFHHKAVLFSKALKGIKGCIERVPFIFISIQISRSWGGISSSSSEESVKDGVRKAGPSSTLIEFTAEPGENPLQVPGTSLVGDKDSLALSKSASSPLIWLFSGVEKRGCGSVAIAML